MIGITLRRNDVGALALVTAAAVAALSAAPAHARLLRDDPSRITVEGASQTETSGGLLSGGSNDRAISISRDYLGGNPTGRGSRWCADFMNLVERKMGRDGTGSRMAKSYLAYGKPVSNPQPGDIVVLTRPGGGHVGYFMGFKDGRIELISGNHGRKVGIGTYPTSRVLGFRRP